jgi:predicted RNA polymerase sigma factor
MVLRAVPGLCMLELGRGFVFGKSSIQQKKRKVKAKTSLKKAPGRAVTFSLFSASRARRQNQAT